MDLIKKLGGYEKAKNEMNYLNDSEYAVDHCYAHEIGQALLDYRREHNIFEVGDKVVSRCADNETRIFTYHSAIGKNIIAKCKKGKGYCYPKKWFSHATNAEIKAGHRL